MKVTDSLVNAKSAFASVIVGVEKDDLPVVIGNGRQFRTSVNINAAIGQQVYLVSAIDPDLEVRCLLV